jgi:hypothetical protein
MTSGYLSIKNIYKMENMNKLFRILLPAILFLFLSGCEKWEVPVWSHAAKFRSLLSHLKCEDAKIAIKEEEWELQTDRGSITGTWKLLLDFSAGDTIDRSCTSALYTFHADGTVTIESSIKEIPGGTFPYEYYNDPYCPVCLPSPNVRPNLVIGENEYFCQVSPSWLVTFFVNHWEDGEELRTTRGEFEKVFHKIN